jgi:hypothetical protein
VVHVGVQPVGFTEPVLVTRLLDEVALLDLRRACLRLLRLQPGAFRAELGLLGLDLRLLQAGRLAGCFGAQPLSVFAVPFRLLLPGHRGDQGGEGEQHEYGDDDPDDVRGIHQWLPSR